MKSFKEFNEGIFGEIGSSISNAANKIGNIHALGQSLFRFRGISPNKVLGISKIKQRVKTATGINFLNRNFTPNRIKMRVKNYLGIYGGPTHKDDGSKKIVPKVFDTLNLPHPKDVMTRYREMKHGRLFRTLSNTRSNPNDQMKFNKLKTTEPKAKARNQIAKSKFGYKPPKQRKNVAIT